jgi:predicted molibdopterin-dependent oxidoreductase YjgC
MPRTGRVAHLMTHVAAPRLDLHPRDAALLGVTDRGLLRIESTQGSVVMGASLDDGVRLAEVFVPMHWTNQFASSGPIDRLAHAITDPVSGQPDLKGTPVRVTAVAEAWRGNLFRQAGLEATVTMKVGKTICSCFSVGEGNICAAIRDEGLKTVVPDWRMLKAGTNCGSCIPEIKKLLSVKP